MCFGCTYKISFRGINAGGRPARRHAPHNGHGDRCTILVTVAWARVDRERNCYLFGRSVYQVRGRARHCNGTHSQPKRYWKWKSIRFHFVFVDKMQFHSNCWHVHLGDTIDAVSISFLVKLLHSTGCRRILNLECDCSAQRSSDSATNFN